MKTKAEHLLHDFSSENRTAQFFGGFLILKRPLLHFICSLTYIGCQFSLYIFLLVMAGYTMCITLDDKVTLIRALNSGCMVVLAMVLPSLKHTTSKGLNEAAKLLNDRIFKYDNEDKFDYNDKILKTRVGQIRFAISAFTKLLLSSAVVYIFLLPLMQYLAIEDPSFGPVNPYLPLPFYMPFDTTTYPGYALAFLSNAAFYVLMFVSIICFEATYISCAVQLMAQLEILNSSLMNIEKRAIFMLLEKNYSSDEIKLERLHSKVEFQNCLYSCLKENILHHHEILRFKKAVSPYLEGVNGIAIIFFSIILASCIFLIIEEPHLNMAILMALISEIACYLFVSIIGEMITDKSNETALSLYSTPWIDSNENFKLLLKIMATYLKRPIILKSTGFSKGCCLETFGDMLSVGYKIVSILR